MEENIFKIFDSWPLTLSKARKPKGLSNWQSLSHLSEKLSGKNKQQIAYTCAHDSHTGAEHVLGSVVGNLHFLMGYVSPGFHMAPYHWQVIDPSLDEEEAQELYHVRGHPSRPQLWERSELDAEPEGDVDEGDPHPTYAEVREKIRKKKKKDSESIKVQLGVGTYTAVPSEGLVYGEHNGHVYKWEMLKDSFLAAANPDMTEAMNAVAEEKSDEEKSVDKSFSVSETLKFRCPEQVEFDDEVYPLIKALFPSPGSIIEMQTETKEPIYGVMNKSSLDFYDQEGLPVKILVYDALYDGFDLTKGGNVHDSILYNFALSHLGVKSSELEQFITDNYDYALPMVVKGTPTPGFEDVELEEHDPSERRVEVIDNTYRVVLRKAYDG